MLTKTLKISIGQAYLEARALNGVGSALIQQCRANWGDAIESEGQARSDFSDLHDNFKQARTDYEYVAALMFLEDHHGSRKAMAAALHKHHATPGRWISHEYTDPIERYHRNFIIDAARKTAGDPTKIYIRDEHTDHFALRATLSSKLFRGLLTAEELEIVLQYHGEFDEQQKGSLDNVAKRVTERMQPVFDAQNGDDESQHSNDRRMFEHPMQIKGTALRYRAAFFALLYTHKVHFDGRIRNAQATASTAAQR